MLFVLILLFLVILLTLFWLINLFYAQIFGAPSVFASNQAVKDALALAIMKNGQTLIDLGCGDGRSLILASKIYGAKGIGIERSPYCYLKSRFNVWQAKESKNIKILFGDFRKFENEIKKADIIYIYLLNSVLAQMEDWIFKTIEPKTKIVSLAFIFPNHEPLAKKETRNLGIKTYVRLYEQENRK